MKISLALLLFVTPLYLLAHGFDPPKEKSKLRPENHKAHASKPTLLTSESITRLDKIPDDVIVVSCKLMGSGSCRGISILLLDDSGKKILAGNSGISGMVGF